MDLLVIVVSFLASGVGAICGLGGGIIIKPVMDAMGSWSVATVNFLSGTVIFAMSGYSTARSLVRGDRDLSVRSSLPIACGAAAGGIVGKWLYGLAAQLLPTLDEAGAIQAGLLMALAILTIIYTANRDRITPHHLTNPLVNLVVGVALGIVSAFLSIGGGPLNLAVFFFLYDMEIKEAVRNSLLVIFFSQATALTTTLITQGLAGATPVMIATMVVAGLLGGVVGRAVNTHLSDSQVNRLFMGLLAVIATLSCYNMVHLASAS